MKNIRFYVIIFSAVFLCFSCEPEEINHGEGNQIEICLLNEVGDTGGNQETPPPPKKE